MKWLRFVLLAGCVSLLPGADQKWQQKNYGDWTPAETDRILGDSPWAKQGTAFFGSTDEDARTFPVPLPTPQQAGLGGPSQTQASTDGRWDGGVGRMPKGGTPTLPLTIRWDSAIPVRQALLLTHDKESRDTEGSLGKPEKDYVITILGLIPGKNAVPRETDPFNDTPAAPVEPKPQIDIMRTRQGLLAAARLTPKGKPAIHPEDVQVDEATGAVSIFFPKRDPITAADKEVDFETQFGSMKVSQRFRLKDMIYKGKLEL